MSRLQLIGAGQMGRALLGGILESGWCDAGEVRIVESHEPSHTGLQSAFPGAEVTAHAGTADGTVLAVKPADTLAVAAEAAGAGGGAMLSVAAGVTIRELEDAVGSGVAVVRCMPNTPALVRQGASAICAGTSADVATLEWAEALLSSVGVVVRIDESLIDAVTGLSGSGPAYVFLMAEALIEAGVLAGLPRPTAETLAIQTLVGSATLLRDDPRSAAELRAAVTSPGGTTAAGLRVLEQRGVRAALLDAVLGARDRSIEMSAR